MKRLKRFLRRNVANGFTLARLPLAFFGIWLFGHSPYWGLVAIALAAMTDFFDGYVARRFDCESDFGRMLDPATDKVFMAIVLVFALVKTGPWGGAIILWAIVLVELLIAVTSLMAWRRNGLAPVVVKVGKFGMFGRMVAVTLMLLSTALPVESLEVTLWAAIITGGTGVALGVIAWTDYVLQAKLGPALL